MKITYFTKGTLPRLQRRQGSVLFLTLLFLVLINLFAVAFWKLVPVELHSAKRHQAETEAYFASDAAVVDCNAYLEHITSDGNVDNFFNNNGVVNSDGHLVIARSGSVGGWNWEAEIIPGPETFGHNDTTIPNPLRVYKVEAVAKRAGFTTDSQQYRRITSWVKQRSFTDNNWGITAVGDQQLWLFMDTFKLDGDYHTNGPGLLRIEDSGFWSNTEAAIGGDFSFVVPTDNPSLGRTDGVMYSNWGSNGVPYWISGPNAGEPRGNRYDKISANGRAGVKVADEIEMPINTDSVAFGVWGADPPTTPLTNAQLVFGAGSDVALAMNGSTPGGSFRNGLYIDDEVAQIDFSTTAGYNSSDDPTDDNQIIRIYKDSDTRSFDREGPPRQERSGYGSSQDYIDADANEYIEITHVTGRSFTIPAGASVLDSTHSPGSTLNPGDNGGKGWTVVKNNSTNQYAIFQEQGNGAIFATQDIEGVRGVVKGRRTVAVKTDTGSSSNDDRFIAINGDLLYAGTPAGDPPASPDSMLGLIGYAVRMRDQGASSAPSLANPQFGRMFPRRNQQTTANPNYLYCSIFAGRRDDPMNNQTGSSEFGGGFGSINPDHSSLSQGHLHLYGSITEGIRQWKGTGNNAGNSYEFHIDSNLDNAQPPFFPTLPEFDVLTWEEKSVFSY